MTARVTPVRHRRPAIVVAVLLAVLLAVVLSPPSRAGDIGEQLGSAHRLVLDLRGYDDRTTVLAPAALSAPEPATGIGPGSHLLIEGIPGDEEALFGCTANFVWTDGSSFYLGSAGHCFLPVDATATHGHGADADLSGVEVRVCVSDCNFGGQTGFVIQGDTVALGPVVYARQTQQVDGEAVDVGNDFGLVRVPASLESQLRPSMPVFGGPTTTGAIELGDPVCHYGAGVVVGEVWPTMGRAGVGVLTEDAEGWWAAETASTFGDSGSAIQVCELTDEGPKGIAAAGVLTHIGAATFGTTVPRAVEMARDANLSISIVLADDATAPPPPEPGAVTVSGADPDTIGAGTTQVTVSGDGFEPGATVSLSGGKGPAPTTSVTQVSDDGTTMLMDVSVKRNGPEGSSTWDVAVTNRDGGSGVLADGLTVVR